ncbi:hypothetical protein PAXINDRAFT_17184, partial [Paxillus involutus ATCC 200175]
VKGGKKKAKRAALLSDFEPTDESDQEAVGRKSKKGPLSKEALTECEEFGREMEERATALAKKFGKKTRSIFTAASLSMSASRKELIWNMHQSWFFATQGQNDEDVDQLRARQKEHYKVLHDSEEGEEKWNIMRQYYIETAAGVESGPKSSVGRVMAARDAFAKSAAAFCCLQNLHIFGFVIHTRMEEDSRQASRMWAGSPLVRKIIDKNHMDLKRMIDWWTTVIKFTHIQDSEEGPSMPAIGSGRAAMVFKLLIPHGYFKRSILWKRLCHEAENLHFTILNWPEEIPVPDTQFDFHKLDANKVLKLLANFLIDRLGPMYKPEGEDVGENSKGKGKGKGKKWKGKAVKEQYVPQDGDDLAFMAWLRDVINIYRQDGPLAEAIPLVKSRTCPDKASKILLTVGGLHGKKPLARIVDEHNEDVIDEEWPGLARIEQIVSPLPHLTVMVAPLNAHAPLHVTMCLTALALLSVVIHLTALTPLIVIVCLHLAEVGHVDDDVDSNQFEEVVNTHERVPVVKQARKMGIVVERSNAGNTLAEFIPLGTLPHLMSRFTTVIPPAGLLDVTRPITLTPLLFGRRLHMGALYVVTIAPPLLVLLSRTYHMGTMYVVTIAPPLLVLLGRTPLVGTTYVVTIARLRLGLLVR